MRRPDASANTIMPDSPRLSSAEFEEISRFAYQRFGLDLHSGKEELVAARLSKKLREGRHATFGDYLKSVVDDPSGHKMSGLVHALTTHHTSFYRESAHFDLLVKVLQQDFANVPRLRIWSAACSTGEEPFSIASCLAALRPDRQTWEILGTDVSESVLETARRGVYVESAIASLPAAWQRACFLKGQGRSSGFVRVRPEIQERAQFSTFNLVDSAPAAGKWHLIFCRNVMIYFDRPTQERVVQRLASSLEPGGYLLVGHSESLAAIAHGLSYVCPATYRKAAGLVTPKGGRK